jgi:uncharacterized LabA/DUF88 family protein
MQTLDNSNTRNTRVGVFVDVLNIVYSFHEIARKGGIGKIIDFEKMLHKCVGGRHCVEAIAYSGTNIAQGRSSFAGLNEALSLAGFKVKLKEADIFGDGQMKCNWDVGMAIDIPKVAAKLDVVVLVTGDGDFVDLVEELQNQYHCEVEVLAFDIALSQNLRRAADSYSTIGDDLLKPKATRMHRSSSPQPSAFQENEEVPDSPIGSTSSDAVSPKGRGTNRTRKSFPSPETLQKQILAKTKL